MSGAAISNFLPERSIGRELMSQHRVSYFLYEEWNGHVCSSMRLRESISTREVPCWNGGNVRGPRCICHSSVSKDLFVEFYIVRIRLSAILRGK